MSKVTLGDGSRGPQTAGQSHGEVIRAFSDPKSLFIILIGDLLSPNMGLQPEKTRVNGEGTPIT